MAEIEELDPTGGGQVGLRPSDTAVTGLIDRARRLSRAEANEISRAVAWQWQPLALPVRGSFVAARSAAIATARGAGRAATAAAAQDDAREAAITSPGGSASVPRWSWAENGLAAVLIGVIGTIITASSGAGPVAVLFAMLAVAGGVVLLLHESSLVARRRLVAGVEAAALATSLRDLLPAETSQVLLGPWSAAIHD